MSRQFYIVRDGKRKQQVGPLTEEEVLDSLDLGDIAPHDSCIDTTSGKRCLVRDLFQTVTPAPASPSPARSAPGKPTATKIPPSLAAPGALAPPENAAAIQPQAKGTSQAGRKKKPSRDLLYFGHPSILTYWRTLLLGASVAIGGYYASSYSGYFGLAGWLTASLIAIYIGIDRSSSDYLVTPLRVEVIKGILSKSSKEVRIEDIRAINVRTNGLIGLLGVGTVEFASAGSDSVDVAFEHVSRPHRLKKLVRKIQDQASDNE